MMVRMTVRQEDGRCRSHLQLQQFVREHQLSLVKVCKTPQHDVVTAEPSVGGDAQLLINVAPDKTSPHRLQFILPLKGE